MSEYPDSAQVYETEPTCWARKDRSILRTVIRIELWSFSAYHTINLKPN